MDSKPGHSAPKSFTNSIGMKLVLIPAGKFKMGSPKDEKDREGDEQQHEIQITKAFYLGAYEVTQKQFKQVMGYNPSYFSTDGKGKEGVKYLVAPAGGKDKVKGLNTDDFPVENVSWEEATEFCKKLTALAAEKKKGLKYRLPTEAEWEYSCRGGARSSKPFNVESKPSNSLSSKQANFNGNYPYGGADKGPYLDRTCKVGSYKPNGFGLHDMHGNVWEWCSDEYAQGYYAKSPRRDPPGPSDGLGRVARGGSWYYSGANCRSAHRGAAEPAARISYGGFRVAAVPSGE
jgi:formylglycine-generating enzyme required for sulfatase activity